MYVKIKGLIKFLSVYMIKNTQQNKEIPVEENCNCLCAMYTHLGNSKSEIFSFIYKFKNSSDILLNKAFDILFDEINRRLFEHLTAPLTKN